MSNFNVGDTGKSVTFRVFDDSGLAVSDLVAATMPDIYWAGSDGDGTKITLSDLASVDADWSSGGVFEKAGSSGAYRLCLPDAALANEDDITVYGEASGKHLLCEPITVGRLATAAALAAVAADLSSDHTSFLDAIGSPMQAGAPVVLAADQPNYAPATADALAAVAANAESALDLLEADEYTDKSDPDHWHLAKIKRGSGNLATGTKILDKPLYDVDGAPLNSTATVVGEAHE